MSFNHCENKLVTCPYDEAHKLKASRLQLHIAKCKLNHLDVVKEPCPFNATHLFSPGEKAFHLLNCPDRAPLDRSVLKGVLDQNNPFKGRTAVPHFSEPLDAQEENWDEEYSSNVLSHEPPPGAIIEPQPMSKPAERRKLYMELHKMPTESIKNESVAAAPVTKQSPILRKPKQPSEAEKEIKVVKQQSDQAIKNLGLGRGVSSRIAANFGNVSNVVGTENPTYSNIVKDMSNLGLGRGQSISRGPVPVSSFDDDFPALGCGRGVLQAPKQSLRTPGVKPRK